MKSCQYALRRIFLCLVLLLSPTIAFVCDRSNHALYHRRVGSTHLRSGSLGQDHSAGEEIQDAYGRTIRKENNAQTTYASLDDPLTEIAKTETTQQENETAAVGNADSDSNLDPLVICGPSGVGKGTVIESLRKRFKPDTFGFSVSHTTRQPRPGEVHGEHYYFTTVDEIRKAIDDDLFVEHAEVHGNYYGTSKQAITSLQEEQKITILDIDVQGVKSVKESGIPCKYVFVAPPSMGELEARLRGRGTETEEAIWKRLGNAASEMEYGTTKGNFDKIFVNQDVKTTVDEMVAVFLEWFPQLKETILDRSPPEEPYDFLAESDKMIRFPSVRKGHSTLKVRKEKDDKLQVQDFGDQRHRAEANGNHHGYYTVDLEEPEGPRGYPKLGKTNIGNTVLDGSDADEEKAY